MKYLAALFVSAAMIGSLATAASAATIGIVINEGAPTVAIPGGPTTVAYNSAGEQGGGGFTAVTNNAPRAARSPGANGSLEIHGDRSRYVLGSIYENFNGAPAQSLASFSTLSQLTFDWQTAVVGSGQTHAAPAVRIHIMDNGIRSEMIWEYVYNGGTAGIAPAAGWQTAGVNSLFYVNVRDNDGAAFLAQNAGKAGLSINGGTQGEAYLNNALLTQTIGSWQSYYSGNAIITGLSFGAGSGFGSNFTGYIDNVGATVGGNTYSLNFETSALAAVPEPATWAMMIGGFGLVGGVARRRAALRTA